MEQVLQQVAAYPAKYYGVCAEFRARAGTNPKGAFVVLVDTEVPPDARPIVREIGYAAQGKQVDEMGDAYLRTLVDEADHDKELVVTVRSTRNEAAISASVPLDGGSMQLHVLPANAGIDADEGPPIPEEDGGPPIAEEAQLV